LKKLSKNYLYNEKEITLVAGADAPGCSARAAGGMSRLLL